MARPIPRSGSIILVSPSTIIRPRVSQRSAFPSTTCGRYFHATPYVMGRFGSMKASRVSEHRSPTVQKKKAQEVAAKDILKYKNDIGLIPMTWVPHFGENRRKAYKLILKKPGLWFKFYRYWLTYKVGIWFKLWGFRSEYFGSQFFPKKRAAAKNTRPDKKKIVPALAELHSAMYTNFARGNGVKLSEFCLDGIMVSFRERILKRGPNDIFEWRAENVQSKLVNWRFMHENLGQSASRPICLEQAVVRIVSTQALRKGTVDKNTSPEEWDGWHEEGIEPPSATWLDNEVKHENKVEYFVAQRKLVNFLPGEWKVWGFTQETTVDNFEETIIKSQDIEAYSKKATEMDKQKKLSESKMLRPESAV